jgi:hypothetical protein
MRWPMPERDLAAVLDDWRAVQRDIKVISAGLAEPPSLEAELARLEAEAVRLRAEYERLVMEAIRLGHPEPPPLK